MKGVETMKKATTTRSKGRPRAHESGVAVSVTIRLAPARRAKLEELAQRWGTTISGAVGRLVDRAR